VSTSGRRAQTAGPPRRAPRPRAGLAGALAVLALAGCAELAPLQGPRPLATADPAAGIATREEALARLGRPDEVRAVDVGQVLVYRRAVAIEHNPNRYYGEDRGERLDRVERLLLFVDPDGRVVRVAVEPE
jgi:hypothetical protein